MEVTDLIRLGFNRNEAKVYAALTKYGKADANQLIRETKFHKNIVYDNIEKLIDKGLVTYVIEEGRRVFRLAPPESLSQLFEDQEKDILEKKELAEQISHEISKVLSAIPHRPEAAIYRGIKALKTFYNETLKGEDYVTFGAPQESVKIMGETFWFNYNLKRAKGKIKIRMIFNSSIREYGERLKNRFTEIRYFSRDFEPLTETHVQGDKVAIIVWTEQPILFLIQDKFAAQSYGQFFEKMWKEAKL